MYSLPYTFLMWGWVSNYTFIVKTLRSNMVSMIFLMIALLLVCFMGTTLVTRIVPGLAALTCITMIVWCVQMGYDRGNDSHESLWNTSVNALSQRRSHFFETLKPWRYLCGKREQDPENPPPTPPWGYFCLRRRRLCDTTLQTLDDVFLIVALVLFILEGVLSICLH